LNVLKRNPYYSDGYVALLDLYWWSDQDKKSIIIYKKALKNEITNPSVSFKMAKALKRIEDIQQSNSIVDSLLLVYPENQEYKSFKNTLHN
ncbi:hypothetical protein MNBD_BACTEROID04-1060, partial [hydrothermal vent metagenome]